MVETINLLIVEDETDYAALLRQRLLDETNPSFKVVCAYSLKEAFQRLEKSCFDVILVDLSLPDSKGFDTFNKIISLAPTVPIVVLTGIDDESLALETLRSGAEEY